MDGSYPIKDVRLYKCQLSALEIETGFSMNTAAMLERIAAVFSHLIEPFSSKPLAQLPVRCWHQRKTMLSLHWSLYCECRKQIWIYLLFSLLLLAPLPGSCLQAYRQLVRQDQTRPGVQMVLIRTLPSCAQLTALLLAPLLTSC